MEIVIDAVLDGLKDGLLTIPVLYIAYLLMELLERSQRLDESMMRRFSRKAGPVIGSVMGVIPQCGISTAAATLFSTGTITVGTMLAVFFATSDEMLPIMLSSLSTSGGSFTLGKILNVLAGKLVLAIVLGYLADLLLLKRINSAKNIHELCERDECSCDEEEGNVFMAALIHTLKIAVMLVVVTILLNLALSFTVTENLMNAVLNKPVIGELLLAVLGLIPNCSVSVVITRSYLSGIIGIGGLFAGLLSNAGMGLLVLLKDNKNTKENLIIIGYMVLMSFAAGTILSLCA